MKASGRLPTLHHDWRDEPALLQATKGRGKGEDEDEDEDENPCGFYSIKKYYTVGTSGFFKIKVLKIEMTGDHFTSNYELACPIYRHGDVSTFDITIGVKDGSAYQLWDGNDIASTLFSQNLCGEVVFTFESRDSETRTLAEMRSHLSEHIDEERLARVWLPETDE